MELYKVDMNYYNYLHYFESKIPYIESEKQSRPFIGIVLNAVKIICLGIAIIMSSIIAIKYMTSSPEGKADIKKTAIIYVIGAFVLFGASSILGIIKDNAEF